MLTHTYYAQNYAGIIYLPLNKRVCEIRVFSGPDFRDFNISEISIS